MQSSDSPRSTPASRPANGAPEGGWTALIDEISAGEWRDPSSGRTAPKSPFERIAIAESLDGGERDLLDDVGMTGSVVVVCDPNTWDAMGQRVARNLGAPGSPVDHLILDEPHADFAEVERLAEKTAGYDHLVAVGSGTLNDLCKYVTHLDGRSYAVFATSAAMNGYTSTTASMSLASGLKTSVPAHAARGVFVDLTVNAAAPTRLAAAGFGDSICRSVAQTDWWMSHRLLGTDYHEAPYSMLGQDESEMMARAGDIGAGDVTGLGYLHRVLTLCGLGVVFTGVSNHGSMGEHQISHYIDCFARERHPGTVHGEQVGLATLSMARVQAALLDQERPPTLRPTRIDPDDMVRRMGPEIAPQCEAEYRKKALDADGAARLNEKLQELWPTLREECRAFAVPVDVLDAELVKAGGGNTAQALGVPQEFYREAVRHAHEMRNRFAFTDLACDAGLLDDLAAAEH